MSIAPAPNVEKDGVCGPVGYGRTKMEAEHDAKQLLQKAWWKQPSSEVRLPVDPFAIARELGIKVFADRSLPADVSGMLKKQAGYSDPEILLNAGDSRNRQRFTCAHELGHYTQRVKSGKDGIWDYVDRRDPLSSQGLDADEVYANQFAAELLMPRDVVTERAKGSNAAALAIDFGVSGDAMGFRLENLRLR
jgi:Zn-dependent peptidase ImmA (M78 family)